MSLINVDLSLLLHYSDLTEILLDVDTSIRPVKDSVPAASYEELVGDR